MSLVRLWAMARKEFIHVFRDPRSLGIAIAIPVLMLVMFGYALTLDVDHVPLVVWDQSGTPESRDFISKFTGSRYFSLRGYVDRYADLEHAIDARDAMMALVIPADFTLRLHSSKGCPVQLIADGSNSNTATIALGYADAIANAYNQEILIQRIKRAGGRPPRPLMDVRARVWFNEDLKSKNFIVPGLVAVIMSVIAALLTSLTVARERERGTMEQLISTPVKPAEVVLGKLIPYFAIGMFDMALSVFMAVYLFQVPLRGSVILLFAAAALFLLGAVGQGIFFSTVSKNQLMASQLSIMSTFLPAFLLSGFAFAISSMPRPLQFVTYLVPARYFVTLLKGIYLKGVGVKSLYPELIFLAVFCTIVLLLTIRAFKKKLT